MDYEVFSADPTLNMIIWIIYIALLVFMLGFGIYMYVLFFKLARRGIKALDIFIAKNRLN